MTRSWKRTAIWIAVGLSTVMGASAYLAAGDGGEQESLAPNLQIFSQVLSLLRSAYVEEPDLETLFAGSLEGLTDALDVLAEYVPASGVAAFERAREIGIAHSGLWVVKDRGIAYVAAVERGSPAAAAGLGPGDIVSAIDGAGTRRMLLWRIRARLAGEPGSRLELGILRRGETRQVSLQLATYPAPAIEREDRDGFPVLRVGRFDGATVEALSRRLDEVAARGASCLILDLRGAAGGDPEAAYAAAGLFARGELGRLVKRGTTLRRFGDESPPLWSGPLLVLTNRSSQGPAEILAAVLAQRAGAEVVGERTFGHAGRESVRRLPGGALLVLADAFYTGPDGEVLAQPLEPQVRVGAAAGRFGEPERSLDDRILQRALERARAMAGRPQEPRDGRP